MNKHEKALLDIRLAWRKSRSDRESRAPIETTTRPPGQGVCNMDDQYVVVVGNVFDGLALRGPFDSMDDAIHWGDTQVKCEDWVAVRIESTS